MPSGGGLKAARALFLLALPILAVLLAACAPGAGEGEGPPAADEVDVREPAAVGVVPEDIDVPQAVLDKAIEFVKDDYETGIIGLEEQRELGAEFDDWRLDRLERVQSYGDLGVSVYAFAWRIHTTTPEKILLAGGQELDADGWFLDTYPNSWYLLTIDNDAAGDDVKRVVPMFSNEFPADSMEFREEAQARLDAAMSHLGYIAGINAAAGALEFEEVEWLTEADGEKLAALGIDPGDLPNGFYIHDLETGKKSIRITPMTSFTVLEWDDDAQSHKEVLRSTEEVAEILNERGERGVLWRLVLDGDTALRIHEKYVP
jgi:hypothetical protein